MPNWVRNEIVIYGDKKKLEAFIKKGRRYHTEHKQWQLDFNKILPIKKGIPEQKLVDEQRKKWGCKWGGVWECGEDFSNNLIKQNRLGQSYIEFEIRTPWCVPDKFLEYISAKYGFIVEGIYSDEDPYNGGSYDVESGELMYNMSFFWQDAYDHFYGEGSHLEI
jgi:hypothetical protein